MIKLKRKSSLIWFASIILVSPIIYLYIIHPFTMYLFPKYALKVFHERKCGEDQIIYPLIISGRKIIPVLKSEINNKHMIRRGYAILALGHIGNQNEIPYLEKILFDKNEESDSFTVIRAICMIDMQHGKNLLHKIRETGNEKLEKIYKQFFESEPKIKYILRKATFWDALFDRHDRSD